MTKLKKILYIEDDKNIAEIVLAALRELGGFEVTHSFLAEDALVIVQETAPQLILMDVVLPDIDGITAAKTINANRKKPIPVIFMTAKPLAAKDFGNGIGVIMKPFSIANLCSQINQLWANAK